MFNFDTHQYKNQSIRNYMTFKIIITKVIKFQLYDNLGFDYSI